MARPKTRPYRDLAADLGVSTQQARELAHQYLEPRFFVQRGGGQKSLRADTYAEAVEILRTIRRQKIDADAAPDYAEARARREHFEAALAELKFKAQAQELVPVAEVERKVGDAFGKLVTRFLQLPDQRAGQWFQAKTVHKLGVMVEADLRDAMREFRVEVMGVQIEDGRGHEELEPRGEDSGLN